MEDCFSFDVLNSAPESECEESEEIIVLNPSPSLIPFPQSDFSWAMSQISPTGVSLISSPKFIELLVETRKAAKLASSKSAKKSSKKPMPEKQLCRLCNQSMGKKSKNCQCSCKISLDCSDCEGELEKMKKNCSCLDENVAPDSNTSSVIIENASLSKKYSKAMWMLNIIDMLSDSEVDEQQRLLLNLNSTLVVKVRVKTQELAWEVPCEFTVKDLKDLVSQMADANGEVVCDGGCLDPRLMLGFVRLFIWRKNDMLTVEVI